MDVWTLGEKWKAQQEKIVKLEARVKYMEEYLAALTKGNKKNEKLQDKKTDSSSVRTRRQATKKSKSN
tara:strand:- start:2491 stop:2694 length:204 start_codon:yes stop_codon:yes gene_type:complete